MAKTNEQWQQELGQLFVRAGEAQFMCLNFRKALEQQNSDLNTINQKIEKLQKDYRTYLSQNPPQLVAQPQTEPAQEEEVADAAPSTEAL